MTENELMNESALMSAIIQKNQVIINQGKALDEKNRRISELEARVKELEGGGVAHGAV